MQDPRSETGGYAPQDDNTEEFCSQCGESLETSEELENDLCTSCQEEECFNMKFG